MIISNNYQTILEYKTFRNKKEKKKNYNLT